jgi:hypothetical protein
MPAVNSIDLNSASLVNESLVTKVNETGINLGALTATNVINPVCTVTQCVNSSDGIIIGSANYTASACTVKYSGVADGIGVNNTIWKCSYSYTYNKGYAQSISQNLSNGTTNFFGNSSTFFSILAVVVIIALIALIILYISKFRGGIVGV